MDKNTGNSWQIIFAPQKNENPLMDEFLENFFSVSACNYTQDEKIEYVGYASAPIDKKLMESQAKIFGLKLPEYKEEFIPATNWLTKNVIKFPPLETQDFYIYGIHEENLPETNKKTLKIYAATAFGSGQHQTTRSCLELLSDIYHQDFKAQNILDMGCGSGILVLSSLKLWEQAHATAADIDDEAVIVSLQNAADNGLSERIEASAGDGYNNLTVTGNAPYDLIFSNILARPLIDMAPSLANSLKPGGYAILSGFIEEQADWVINAHCQQGLKLIKIIENENWRAALLEKI